MRLEITDPWDRVLAGYSKEDCVPFAADEIDHKVEWKGQRKGAESGSTSGELESKMVSQSAGTLKVKVYMEKAKLYALYARGEEAGVMDMGS